MTLSPEIMLILGAVGGFFVRQFWPWFRAQVDAEFKAKREALKAGVSEREMRYVAAMEQSSAASKQNAEALERLGCAVEKLGCAFETMSKALIVNDLSTQRIERRLDEMVRPARPRARPRKREETTA